MAGNHHRQAQQRDIAKAGVVLKRARKLDGDIVGAARDLDILLTSHDRLIERVTASVERIAQRLEKADSDGTLKFFNASYRARRLQAKANGVGFMTYCAARSRLQHALGDVVASGGTVPDGGMIARVFGTAVAGGATPP